MLSQIDARLVAAANALATEHSGPFSVIDLDRVSSNLSQIYNDFHDLFPDTSLAYSYKTNNLKSVTQCVRELGFGAEVVSGAELEMALDDGFSGEDIYFNGPVKLDLDLKTAIRKKVHIHADSLCELKRILTLARSETEFPDISIRLSAPYGNTMSRFGIKKAELGPAIQAIDESGNRLAGVHLHVGSNLQDTGRLRHALQEYLPLLAPRILTRQQPRPFTLDVGGGYPAMSASRSSAPLRAAEFASTVSESLLSFGIQRNEVRLVCEPGRSVVEDCGLVALRVATCNHAELSATLNVGTNIVRSITTWHHPIHIFTTGPDIAPQTYCIAGANCFEQDVFCEAYSTSRRIERGDLVLIGCAGGYDIPSANVWTLPSHPIYGLKNERLAVIRDAQSVRQMRELHRRHERTAGQ